MSSATTLVSGRDFRVVCLCGSAGALHAYLAILKCLPSDTGMAFVIASHRAVKDSGLLPEALASSTRMTVCPVEHGMPLLPNHVYVMPPGIHMQVVGDVFQISRAPDRRGWPVSISAFLHSAACDLGSRLVAVILSGHGFDGSSELARIKSRGGLILAQAEAQHPEMPTAAEDSGFVDAVLSTEDLAARLLSLAAIPVCFANSHPAERFEPCVPGRLAHYEAPVCTNILHATGRRVASTFVSMASARRSIEGAMNAIERSKTLLQLSERFLPPVNGHSSDPK